MAREIVYCRMQIEYRRLIDLAPWRLRNDYNPALWFLFFLRHDHEYAIH